MDETSSKVKGPWDALSRAVEKTGQRLDCLRTAQRDEQAAQRCLPQAIRRHGVPEQSSIDGSAAKEAAVKSDHEAHGPAIAIREVTDRHTVVEHDQRGVKRVTRAMLGFKAFGAAQDT